MKGPAKARPAGRLVLRELTSPKEFAASEEVSKAAWDFTDRAVSPASDLIAATHAGGLTAGAFEDGRLVGFVHGVPRTNMGQPCQHSHLLAVRPDARRKGLGLRLKLFQRAWCLERGIRLVTWTYDPFLLRNARLNLVKLRATARRLLPDFYGPMGGIYGTLPTDRFELTWRLDDPLVERAAETAFSSETPDGLPAAVDELPIVTARRAPEGPRALLPFLAGAPAVYRTDPEGSLAARRRFARLAVAAFERGYEATSVVELPSGPAYLLERR